MKRRKNPVESLIKLLRVQLRVTQRQTMPGHLARRALARALSFATGQSEPGICLQVISQGLSAAVLCGSLHTGTHFMTYCSSSPSLCTE